MKMTRPGIAFMGIAMIAIMGCMPGFAQDRASRQRTRENVITLMMLRMTQALELTEEQTAVIFPMVTRIEREKRDINIQIRDRMQRIRRLTGMTDPEEQDLKTELENIKRLKHRLRDIEGEFEAFLERRLTLEQQARYVLFAQDFYKSLRENLSRARNMQRPKRPPEERRPE